MVGWIDHALALTALRWRLYRKRWGLSEAVNLAWTLFLTLGGIVVAGGMALWLFRVGRDLGAREIHWPFASLLVPLLLSGLYAVCWLTGLFYRTIRNDMIEPRKVMHLPVAPTLMLGLNFMYSLLTPLPLITLPAGLGFIAGLWVGASIRPLPGLVTLLGFLFFHAALAFHVRGMLAILVDHPRKKRAVFALITLGILVLCQLPGLIALALRSNLLKEQPEVLWQWLPLLSTGVSLLPSFWGALGCWGLLERNPAITVLTASGLWLLGFILLRTAARDTLAYYLQGGMYQAKSGRGTPERADFDRPVITLRRLPGLSDATGALTWLFLVNLARNPHMRLQGVALVGTGAFLMVLFRSGIYGDETQTFLLPLLLVWPSASLGLYILNAFGVDGPAFRGLSQLPISGIRALRARHIALVPFTLAGLGLMYVVGAITGGVTPKEIGMVCLAAVPYFLTFFAVGAWTSVLIPFPMTGRGSHRALGRSSPSGYRTIGILLTMALILVLSSCAGWILDAWRRTSPVGGTIAWILWAAGAALGYFITLRRTGDLLQRRWPEIAAILARDTME